MSCDDGLVNLLCRDLVAKAAFFREVAGMAAHRVSADCAIMLHAGLPGRFHSDVPYASLPLLPLVLQAGPRGSSGGGTQRISKG